MQHKNSVHLRGIVSRVCINNGYTRLTLVTASAYKAGDGSMVVENTWHSVVSFNKVEFNKNQPVEVEGRLRNHRLLTAEGKEVISTEIIATKITEINETLEIEK